MLSPQYLEQLPEPLIALWQQVEDDILRDIARRIQKMGTITETAAYQAWRLEQTKLLHTDIVKLISKYSGKSETAIRKMLVEAGTQTLQTEDAIHAAAGVTLPEPNKSQNLQNLLNAGYRQTAGTWKNLTATTANTVSRQFEDALDRAWLQVSSGAFDYQTAIRRAIHDLAEHMDGVTYPSGHRDSLEVAVRRATLTGVNQTCGKLQLERAQEAGCEFVEVTAHVGARDTGSGPANHASWQGKVYHVGGPVWYEGEYYKGFEETTGYGTGPGLCGWNCRHNFFSFWPGISSRVYTDEQLQALCAKDIEYKGKKYSRYEINQMQRARERQVRKWKKTYLMEKEAGLDTTQSALQLKEARKALSDFAGATGGRVDSSRTAVNNFGHSTASKATWEARKATTISKPEQQGNEDVPKQVAIEDVIKQDTAKESIQEPDVPLHFADVTNNWYPDAIPGSHEIKDLQDLTIDGVTYKVDGHNVVLSYSQHEKEIADLLEKEVGGELYMVPRVNYPQGISTPDYIFHGKEYDLKTIGATTGKNPIVNRIKKAKRQADNFILDVSKSSLSDSELDEQLKKIFTDTETRFVKEIVVVKDGKIIKVLKRK